MIDEDIDKKIEELNKQNDSYAKENGFRLNPDQETVKRIARGLLENERKHGQKYCPCRRITGDKEADAKNICPCVYHRQELEADGHCLCLLFVK
ncbi:MAG: ferredoxin-thioredoxin reductase catalytic domain-containing protein [Candidatus Staskawiczbacteria bacterium]|jgi:ferredoxin-thioredoxin reductase catalytic subunit